MKSSSRPPRARNGFGSLIGLTAWIEMAVVLAAVPNPQVLSPTSSPVSAPGLLRCTHLSTAPDAPPGSDIRKIEAELYVAVMRLRMQDDPQGVVVEAISIPMPQFRVRDDRGLMDALPADLKTRIIDGLPDCFQQTADRFPTGTRLVPLAEIRQGVTRGRADWPSFRERFGARMWFGFSRALIGLNQRDAVVFYERFCDGLCGEGEWVWLHRESPTSPWRVMKEIWNWIS